MLKRIQISYFFRYLGDALFYPFMSLYLVSKGIDGTRLGLILGALPFVAILANFVCTFILKNHRFDKIILLSMLVFEGVLILIYGLNLTFVFFLITTIFLGLVNTPYYSLLDSYTSTNIINENEYPKVRIMGTFAYVIGGALGGYLIDYLGYFYVFLIAFITYLISFIFLLTLKTKIGSEVVNEKAKVNLKIIFNSRFIVYLLFYVFVLGSKTIFDAYFNVYLESLSFDVTTIGIINSLIIVSEFIMMLIMIKLLSKKINLKKMLVFCACTLIVKDLLFSLPLPSSLLVVISMLRGVGWGGFLAMNITIITQLVKKENLTPALMIIATVYGLYRSIATIVAGSLYVEIGFKYLFLIIALLELLGTLILVFSKSMGELYNEK
ncbi:MAG: MFS transporter [Bacilli bacterium]|nr:MFS transporter [Bacilli bacterium]